MLGNSGSFATQTSYAVTMGSSGGNASVVLADINGDGIVDLAVGTGTLNGNSNGTFAAWSGFTGGKSEGLVDVNGDGVPDLITTSNQFLARVGCLLGNGNSTFQTQNTFAAGYRTVWQVATGDLNGDGKPDLATVCNSNNGSTYSVMTTLLGNGNGTFGARTATQVFTSLSEPRCLALGDLRNSGVIDCVVGNDAAGTLAVLLGNGNNTFAASVNYSIVSGAYAVALGDVNGDGYLDIAVACPSSGAVAILIGNTDGTFQSEVTYAVGTTPNDLCLADVNGDGKLDLVVSNYGSNNISVLLANGNGTFQSQTTFATGTKPWGLAVFYPQSGITEIQTGGAAATSASTTKTFIQSSNPTTGNLLVVDVSAFAVAATPTFTITDTLGNTYTAGPRSTNGFLAVQTFYCLSCTGGGSNTITCTANTSSTISVAVTEYHCSYSILFDAQISRSGSASTSFASMGPNIQIPMEMVHATVGMLGASTITVPTGFTERYNSGGTVSTSSLEVSDILSCGSISYPAWTAGTSLVWASVCSSFRRTP